MQGTATWQVEGQPAAVEAATKLIGRSAWFTVEPRPFDWYHFSVKAGEGHEIAFNTTRSGECDPDTLLVVAARQAECIIADHVAGVERTAWPEVLTGLRNAIAAKEGQRKGTCATLR